ncbi:MAG: 2-dehydropantoate 2-reductase N-terminal domain-containing protein, partial [Desulfobacterales bacterium]
MQSQEKIEPGNIKIGVVGAGSWGTALANLLASKGFSIDWWVFEKEVIHQIQSSGENQFFLPDIKLSANLKPHNELAAVVSGKDLLLLVVPSHVLRDTALKMADHVSEKTVVASASKGIENKTHLTMTGVLQESLPQVPAEHLAVISGPSFAREVAMNLPTVVTAASRDQDVAALVQQ